MKRTKFLAVLLAVMAFSIQAWSYRFTDNYTIETKFKINAIGAGIAFRAYEGYNGAICMWQFNVGTDGSKSLFRPHDWKVGGILLGEINTCNKGVTLNNTDWFVTRIVISNNGQHADTYLRRADTEEFTLIDSRDGNFRYGLIGTRQDHDGNVNESASYDYFLVTDNETGDVLYNEDFEATNGDWRNNPGWENGCITTEGRNLSEVKYFPNNMFKSAKMHYAVEADLTIVNGYASLVFGLGENGSNYMWQISPNYYNDTSVNTYYHLDKGNENWKAHAAGPRYPDFEAMDFWEGKRHVKIEVDGNVVNTYVDDKLEDSFVQSDMTDLELLNTGKIGIRVDAGNGVNHEVYVDNVKLTEYDSEGNPTVKMEEKFDGGVSRFFELSGKNATYAKVEDWDGDYALHITCDGTVDKSAKVRLIQADKAVCPHNFVNGICTICEEYQEPGYDIDLSAYTIGNLGQLIRFSQIVNGGEQDANGSLTADIDMENNQNFQPIGLNNDDNWQKPFRGTFYGNNHVISNLYVKTECEGGLFSRTFGGKIFNLGVENAYIQSTANLRCGVIVGEHHANAQMVDCYARGTIQFVTDHAQKNAIAGEGAGGHFVNCYTTLPKICCDLPMGGTITNSYDNVTEEQAKTGEIAYKLGVSFRQTLDTDTWPGFKQTSLPVSYVGTDGYATIYDETTGYELNGDVNAYVAVKNPQFTNLILTKVENVPASTAIILKGTYYNKKKADLAALNIDNELKGTASETQADGTMYVLAKPEGEEVGFYLAENGTTIPAGKAYYQAATPSVKAYFFAGEGTTAITNVNVNKNGYNDAIYNIAGQRVSKLQKGINIVNGKKILK